MKTITINVDDSTENGQKLIAALEAVAKKETPHPSEPKDVTERINSYENACQDQGKKILTIEDFKAIDDEIERNSTFAHHKAQTIIRSWNEGWKPDFRNSDQYKYYIWAYWENGGFALSRTLYDSTSTDTCVGSRLYFKSYELSQAFIKQFPDLCQELVKF